MTVVAFYGEKSFEFTAFLKSIQHEVSSRLPDFEARPIPEIHATVMGLENPITQAEHPSITGWLDHLRQSLEDVQLSIRFGGFADCDYPISSRGIRLYNRSLVITDHNVVLIGWPIVGTEEGLIPLGTLDVLRKSAQRFGFRHRYHNTLDATDPDAYMVIGKVPRGAAHIAATEVDLRNFLQFNSFIVRLYASDISLVRYESTDLPLDSTVAVPIDVTADGRY